MGAGCLSDVAKSFLLDVVRRELQQRIGGAPDSEVQQAPEDARESGAAFVTLRRGGALRGCIGSLQWDLPLEDVVRTMAWKAASQDPRFPPVRTSELDELRVEISVLTPPAPIAGEADVIVGEHGLLLTLGEHRGLLLPQVATERGWDARTFLEHTARKAGLAANDWQLPDARLEAFTAEHFSDAGAEA